MLLVIKNVYLAGLYKQLTFPLILGNNYSYHNHVPNPVSIQHKTKAPFLYDGQSSLPT